MFHSWHQSACQQLFWHMEKLIFLTWINLRNILLFGFVKFELKQWLLAYQEQVCAWFSLARLPTEAARNYFCIIF